MEQIQFALRYARMEDIRQHLIKCGFIAISRNVYRKRETEIKVLDKSKIKVSIFSPDTAVDMSFVVDAKNVELLKTTSE